MIKANLRRQIEMEEDRKAVRRFLGGGCLYFCTFPLQELCGNFMGSGPTNTHSFSHRPTNSCSHGAAESGLGLAAVGYQGVIMPHVSLSVTATTQLCGDNHDTNVLDTYSLI